MGKFGDKFRRERERQGIKLEDVSTSTKISSRMLRAIEDEHFDQLPGGVFNKGFIRAYAKHLGLDEEEAVTAYLATLNQQNGNHLSPQKPAQPERRAAHSAERWEAGNDRRNRDRRIHERRGPSSESDELPDLQLPKAEHIRPRRRLAVHSDEGIPWRLTAAVLILVVLAAALWWSHSRNVGAHASNAPPNIVTSSKPPVTASPAAPTITTTAAAPAPPHPAAKAASHSASSSSASSSSASPSTTGPITSGHTNEAAPPTNAASPAPQPRANLTLVIRAVENSWISVTADGQPVLHETLIAPAHTSIRAARQIAVRSGNAAGVTFSLNGQDFPAQGAEGEVKTLIFDASGLLPAAAPATAPDATTPPTFPIP
ncbi:MAG TPA: helix-turn-helix domain-containing protein [Candidatus Sulfotelmatobacter sp.]